MSWSSCSTVSPRPRAAGTTRSTALPKPDTERSAPSQRGYSEGARPEGVDSYSVTELCEDVLAMAATLGRKRFHVVGHDWGGSVAWALAGDHPEAVVSLTAVSTPAHGRVARRAARCAAARAHGVYPRAAPADHPRVTHRRRRWSRRRVAPHGDRTQPGARTPRHHGAAQGRVHRRHSTGTAHSAPSADTRLRSRFRSCTSGVIRTPCSPARPPSARPSTAPATITSSSWRVDRIGSPTSTGPTSTDVFLDHLAANPIDPPG